MFDLPHPFGPTTAVRPFVGKLISVLWAKDLNPKIFNFVICTARKKIVKEGKNAQKSKIFTHIKAFNYSHASEGRNFLAEQFDYTALSI